MCLPSLLPTCVGENDAVELGLAGDPWKSVTLLSSLSRCMGHLLVAFATKRSGSDSLARCLTVLRRRQSLKCGEMTEPRPPTPPPLPPQSRWHFAADD